MASAVLHRSPRGASECWLEYYLIFQGESWFPQKLTVCPASQAFKMGLKKNIKENGRFKGKTSDLKGDQDNTH